MAKGKGALGARAGLIAWYGVALMACAGLSLVPGGTFVVGALGVLFVAAFFPIAWMLARREEGADPTERLDEIARHVRAMVERANLSEEARRVLGRRTDREILCQAIEEDLASGDFDAAALLVRELADRLGARAEAEEYRRRVEQARSERTTTEVTEQVAYLDGLILQRRWNVALADAARIARLYPESPMAERLRGRVEEARARHKAELEQRFLVAARADQVEVAMATLKELDEYLTEGEAEPLREVARGVVSKAREGLGAEFKLAIQEKRWRDATLLGERILGEFPNTRMAQEVREVMDHVRERAAAATAL